MSDEVLGVLYSTRLGLRPEFGKLLADECAAYLGVRFPGSAFDVVIGGTSPLSHRSYSVVLRSPSSEPATMRAAAEAFAYGFRVGWAQRGQRPHLTDL